MKRLHVHVSVDNLDDSIRFYSSMFAATPTVLKDDYAKWMLDDPQVNFAISQRGAKPGLDHLGIQVDSGTELTQMQARLQALQPEVEKEEGVSCCYAKSDKYWVTDPQGIAWETFHTLDGIPVWGQSRTGSKQADEAACCAPTAAAPLIPMQRDSGRQSCAPAASGKSATGNCC
jgi:catechol 2,3-dioxygenase-like lactoylglutathione lyase family enzyme